MIKLNEYLLRLKSSKEFSDVFYLLLLQGVNYILPIAVIPYLMITLGVERYGYLGFSIAFVQYFVLVVDFGFNLSATKRIAIAYGQNKKNLSNIFFSTFYSKIILLLISTIFFLIFGFFVPQFKPYFVTMLYTYPMMIGATISFSWFYQGIGKIKAFSLINTGSKLLILPLIFFLVKTQEDYNIAAIIQSSVFVFSGIIAVSHLIRMKVVSYSKVSSGNIKIEMKESFPLFLSSVATSMYTQLFIIILGLTASPSVVGRYSAAERIMRSLCFVLYTPISQVFYPKIASLSIDNRLLARKLFEKLLYLVGSIMCCVFIGLFFFSDFISHLLGEGYQGISRLLKIMSFAPLAIGLGGVFGQMGLIAIGDNRAKKDFQKVYFVVAPISLLSVTILTPYFQEIGAAIALLITEYFVLVLMAYYCNKNKVCY